MKGLALCLTLLLAFSASANSVEEALCGTTALTVARMERSEKLCRSFSRALAALPATVTDDAKALLTPTNLALMGTLTVAWVGSQGVPLVGELVDAALLALGVTLLAGQALELTQFLWTYVNRATTARNPAELDEAGTSLARAISLVGINVVAFILTKKALAEVPRGPPVPPRRFALPEGPRGGRISGAAAESTASTVTEPVVLTVGHSEQARDPSKRGIRPIKKPDPIAFEKWIRPFRRRAPSEDSSAALDFQRIQAGPEEILVEGGGEQAWADGARASDSYLLDAKHVGKPGISPYVNDSACNEGIRQIIRSQEEDLFSRYAAIILDPATPVVGLEVIVNDARAVPYFEALMREYKIPGRVVVK